MNSYRPSKLSNRSLIDGISGAFMVSYDGGIRKGTARAEFPEAGGKKSGREEKAITDLISGANRR